MDGLAATSLDGNGPVKGVGGVSIHNYLRQIAFTKDSSQVIYTGYSYHGLFTLKIFDLNSDERTLISPDFGVSSSGKFTSFSVANNTDYLVFNVFTWCAWDAYPCDTGRSEIYTSYYLNARHLILPNVAR